jgi:actin-related protein
LLLSERVFDPEERRSTAELTEILIRFLHEIFYERLLVKTTDRRVVLIEPIASPARFRQTIVDLLYRHYLVMSVLQLPAATVATVPLWLNTALVVDCGHTETTVTAVFDGVPAVNSFRAVPAAAAEVHAQVKTMLAGVWDDASDAALEDIKVRACVAGRLPDGVALPALRYTAKGLPASIELSSKLRAHACDSLFDGVGDGDASSVPSAILDALRASPVDARKALARNIVLCGGTAMLPGFKHRLAGAIAELAKEPEYRALAGTLSKRCVVTVTLKAAEVLGLELGDLRGNAHRVLDDLLDRLRTGGVQVSDASVEVADEKKVVCTFVSPDADVDEALIRKDKSSILVGRRTCVDAPPRPTPTPTPPLPPPLSRCPFTDARTYIDADADRHTHKHTHTHTHTVTNSITATAHSQPSQSSLSHTRPTPSYAVVDINKTTEESSGGVVDVIAFAETDVPANILQWVGASILGALETLPSKSVAREGYLTVPAAGPDFTANCLERTAEAQAPEPKQTQPDKWKVKIGRPMAWGCGSLAVPPEVQQHAV